MIPDLVGSPESSAGRSGNPRQILLSVEKTPVSRPPPHIIW